MNSDVNYNFIREFRREFTNLDELKNGSNLFAFSHGIDSTALFWILSELEVNFDCALVNYKTRATSDDEERAARELCTKFGKKIFVRTATLDLKNGSNFECKARKIRYDFFDEICIREGYSNLILAHQLNDAFEWFLMQISKGVGVVNSLLDARNEREINLSGVSRKISVIRPLINIEKSALKAYLDQRKIKYFIDESNSDVKFKRNFFRAEFANKFISEFASGARETMKIMRTDKAELLGEFIFAKGRFFLIEKNSRSLNLIDKACKKLGILISQEQRKQILSRDCVVSGKIVVASDKRFYFVAPFIKVVMEKSFKESCRTARIPPLVRGFLSQNLEIFIQLHRLLSEN